MGALVTAALVALGSYALGSIPFGYLAAVRATMGSIFAVPLTRTSEAELAAWRAAWRGSMSGVPAAAMSARLMWCGSSGSDTATRYLHSTS